MSTCPAVLEPQRLVGSPLDDIKVVADEKHRHACSPKRLEALVTLAAKALVADREHLVQKEYLGIDGGGRCKANLATMPVE